MQWTDTALVLGGRRFGESGLILDVLTETRGRRAGLVYGGASRRRRGQFEIGNTVTVSWMGRLEEQLGRFDVAEATISRAAHLLDDPRGLAALGAVTALLQAVVEEGDTGGSALFEPSIVLLDALRDDEVWPALYVRWEFGLLSALGYGLDLTECALSGANDGLTHVSPKTGRAVRGAEAEDWIDRLLPLPGFLLDPLYPPAPGDIADGLALTAHFLNERLFYPLGKPMPESRARLAKLLATSGDFANRL